MTFAQFLSDGHIAIPQDVIDQLRLQPGDTLKLMVDDMGVLVLIRDEEKHPTQANKLTEAKKQAIYQELAQSELFYPTAQDAMQATRNWEKDW